MSKKERDAWRQLGLRKEKAMAEKAVSSRFSYVKYDEQAVQAQEAFKVLFEGIESLANEALPNSREKSLLMTALEEAYMWTGKAIRNEQIARNAEVEHAPARG